MEKAICILVFITVVLTVIGLHQMRISEKERLNKRLDSINKEFKDEILNTGKTRNKIDISNILSLMGKNFSGMSFARKIENQLAKADILMRSEEFIGLNIATTGGGFLLGFLLLGRGSSGFILAVIGLIIPWLVVWHKKKARAAQLNSEIGECLTGMSNSLRAGYSFQQAMDMISRETIGPLATEFRRTMREINLGITTEQALQNLINRVEDDDLELMIGAVLIQRQVGGNLAEIFDNIAETIRQRIRLQGDVKTLTAQGRVSGLVVGMLPVVLTLLLMLIDPDYLSSFFASRIGWVLMGAAVVSEIIGFSIMHKITDIHL